MMPLEKLGGHMLVALEDSGTVPEDVLPRLRVELRLR